MQRPKLVVVPVSLFHLGNFTLHSGDSSNWKLDCDALTDDDLETIAYLIAERVHPFGHVVGIPSGGLRLAVALEPYRDVECQTTLLVDDVITTGASFARAIVETEGSFFIGAAIFNRGTCPNWVMSLFTMTPTP